MTDTTILVLGASHHQLDVIAEGHRRGLRVAVADNLATNPGHQLADASHVVDTTDVDLIERVARLESVQGVLAPCTDVAVPTAATVAARLGLPGVPEETAQLVTSKARFRRWQHDRGLPAPEAFELDGRPSLPGAGRWVVKPDRSSGSKGIRIVEGERELAAAYEAARDLGGGVVVERAIVGHQVTMAGLLRGGRLSWWVLLDRQTAHEPWCATTGHRVPTRLPEPEAAAAIDALSRTVQELGLEEGPLDADLVVGDEAVVLELSPRLGGNSITGLLRLATGVDLAGAAIEVALGRPTPTPQVTTPAPTAVVLIGADRRGALRYDVDQFDALRSESWVAGIELAPPGTPVRPFIDGRAQVGRAFLKATDRDGVDARAGELLARLSVGCE
jgi:biotin carboxylase